MDAESSGPVANLQENRAMLQQQILSRRPGSSYRSWLLSSLLAAIVFGGLPLCTLANDVAPLTSWTTGTSGPSRWTSGTDRLLIFIASMESGSDRTISSVTYGGRSMTQIITRNASGGAYARTYMFYLNDSQISAASSNTFSVTWSGSTDDVHYAARMYQYVDQANPIRDSDSASTNTSSPNPILTPNMTVEDGDYVVAGVMSGNTSSYSWNNSFSEGTDQTGSTSQQSAANRAVTYNGNMYASATNSNPNRQVIVGAVLRNNTVPEPKNYYIRSDGNDANTGLGPGTGSAWRTFYKALRDSPVIPGDTIYVRSGTYTETVYPNEDGTSALPINVIADISGTAFGGSGGAVIIQAPTDSYAMDFNGDDYFNFRDFTIRGSNVTNTVSITDSAGVVFERCKISLGGMGVQITGSGSTATFFNCLIHNTSNDGIRVESGTAIVLNTTIASIGSDGFEQNAGTSYIYNSIVAFSAADGMDLNGGSLAHAYNLVYGSGDQNFEGTGISTGELTQNPDFADMGAGDFSLQGGSPAIDAGTDASSYLDEDILGVDRPLGGGWDMGCYEFPIIATWPFDEGSGGTSSDDSGNGHDATLMGSTTWSAVRCGQAVTLNGSSDWIDLGQLDLGTKSFTMAGWFRTNALKQQTLFAGTATGTSNHAFFVELDADGHMQFVYRSPAASSGGITLYGNDNYADGAWHYVAAVKSSTQLLLYVDGELVDLLSNSTEAHSSVDLVFGRRGKNNSENHFQGSIDDVLLYGSALSATEIPTLSRVLLEWKLNSTSGSVAVDSTIWGRNGTIYGNPVWLPTGGQVDGALQFDGTDDEIEALNVGAYLNGLSEVTVSLWVKSNVTNVDKGLFYTADPTGNDDILGLRYDKDGASGGGVSLIKASIKTTTGDAVVESSSNVQTTSWQHLTMVWKSGEALQLYVNGHLNTPAWDAGARTGTITGIDKLLLGVGTKNAHWNGLIDDFRIYDRALCSDEILNLATGGGSAGGVRVIKWIEVK